MEPSRFARVVAPFVPLFLAFMAAESLTAVTNETGSNLDCTNDFHERMFCLFKAQSCAGFSLTLRSNSGYGSKDGLFQPCGAGQCCCSVLVGGEMLISGDTLTATVRTDARVVESQEVDVVESIKPNVPTIVSLKNSSGNVQLMWRTNVQSNYLDITLSANVTYYKKGSAEKVTKSVGPTTVGGLKFYEIPGGDLEPSTTYVVSVRSYTSWSGKYSDSSPEMEFTTGVSPHSEMSAIVIILSVSAVMVTAIISGCYVQVKKKWWDSVATSNPHILYPSKILTNQIFKPEPSDTSLAVVSPKGDDVESCPQESSTESNSKTSSSISSDLSYANTEPTVVQDRVPKSLSEIFPHIGPGSLFIHDPVICAPAVNDTSSGSSGMDNRSYSLVIPSSSQKVAADGSEGQTALACVSAYHPSEGDTVPREQQAPACLLVNLSLPTLMPTDMSYHQCKAESEDSGLSSVSSGSNAVSAADPCCDEAIVCDDNPCYAHVPAGSGSFPLVVDDYQAFQNMVRQPDVWRKAEESLTLTPVAIPFFPHSVLGDQCLPEPRPSLISLMCSQIPVITHTGYQSV